MPNNERDKVDTVVEKTLSTEQLVGVLKALGFDNQTIDESLTKPRVEASKPTHWGTQHFGYIVRANGFETFVSWREANSEAEAYDLCKRERHQCWALVGELPELADLTTDARARSISHNEYCEWLRSRDA